MQISYKQIMTFNPCYDPKDINMSEDYEDTIVNFINEYRHKVKQKKNIVWTLCKKDFLNDTELRLFAVWCARQVQHLMKDQRSIDALDVAERFALGLATEIELANANAAAYAAYAAAAYAAYAYYANANAYAAAAAADAYAAADAAANAYYAYYAYYAAARNKATDIQIDKLLEMFKGKDLLCQN